MKKILLGIFLSLFLISIGFSDCDYYISGCQDLNETGKTYCLNSDIIDYTGLCFHVYANDITLDCQNHLVDGNDTNTGLSVTNSSRATIQNCIFRDWKDYAILFGTNTYYANWGDVFNCTFISNWEGIRIQRCNGCEIDNVTTISNERGIFNGGFFGGNVDITNSNLTETSFGGGGTAGGGLVIWYEGGTDIVNTSINTLDFFRSRVNNFRKCNFDKIRFQSGSGYNSYNNRFYDNYFDGTETITWDGGIQHQYWYINPFYGERIQTDGRIGGNYWQGYTESCTDSDKDGFCDTPYTVNATADNLDYYPYSDECESNWTIILNDTSCVNNTTSLNTVTWEDFHGCEYPNYTFSILTYTNCLEHYECDNGTCVYVPYCGDDICQTGSGETQQNCCIDCGVPDDSWECKNNTLRKKVGEKELRDIGSGIGGLFSRISAPLVVLLILMALGTIIGYILYALGYSIEEKL